ncbi:MAG: hypothetical protein JWQ76_5680 [Ramlibacter sp.]|nr:hypothetical protein [Ramlibacter sp.]
MQKTFWFLAAVLVQMTATGVYAQTDPPTAADKAAARAERRVQGAEAARSFQPGEDNPVPERTAKVPRTERIAARQARKPEGVEAARSFQPGEGNPVPAAAPKVSKSERVAARAARRAEMKRAQKAGEIPVDESGPN